MKTECPRCGTKLRKEKTEAQNVGVNSERYTGGSVDVHSYRDMNVVQYPDYVYVCPNCGYLSTDC